jgi:PAS domain S-box-containing protein
MSQSKDPTPWDQIVSLLVGRAVTLFAQDADLRYEWIANAQGVPVVDLIGRTDADVLHDLAELDALVALKRRAMHEGRPVRSRLTLHPGGEPYTFDTFIAPRTDPISGRVIGVLGVGVDVSASAREEAPNDLGFLLMDADGKCVFADAVTQRLVGRSLDGMIGLPLSPDLVSSTDPGFRTAITELSRNPRARRVHLVVRTLDGDERWLRARLAPIIGQEGSLLAVIAVIEDVTAAKRMEQYLQAALQGSGGVLFVQDLEMRYEWIINPQLDFSPERVVGRTDVELLGAAGEALEAAKRRAIAADERIDVTIPITMGDKLHVYDLHVAPVRDLDGQVMGVSGAAFDVTEAAMRQRQLDELARFVDAMPIGLWATAPDGTHLFQNESATRLVGQSSENIRREGWFHLVHADDLDRTRSWWTTLLTGVDASRIEVRVHHPVRGERWLRAVAAPLRDEQGRIHVLTGTLEDVTEERRRQELLTQQARLETIGLLAGGVAHDFNNLLATISGFAELAAMHIDEGHRAHGDLNQILTATRQASVLARRVLEFARQGAPEIVATDVTALASQTVKLMRAAMKARVEIEFESLAPPPPLVNLVPSELQRVLVNLITNSAYAMRDREGVICVRVATRTRDGMVWAELAVQDSGVGMSAETLARASTLFFTTKPAGEGTGLGLSHAKGVAVELGGTLEIESTVDIGTVVRLLLPVA